MKIKKKLFPLRGAQDRLARMLRDMPQTRETWYVRVRPMNAERPGLLRVVSVLQQIKEEWVVLSTTIDFAPVAFDRVSEALQRATTALSEQPVRPRTIVFDKVLDAQMMHGILENAQIAYRFDDVSHTDGEWIDKALGEEYDTETLTPDLCGVEHHVQELLAASDLFERSQAFMDIDFSEALKVEVDGETFWVRADATMDQPYRRIWVTETREHVLQFADEDEEKETGETPAGTALVCLFTDGSQPQLLTEAVHRNGFTFSNSIPTYAVYEGLEYSPKALDEKQALRLLYAFTALNSIQGQLGDMAGEIELPGPWTTEAPNGRTLAIEPEWNMDLYQPVEEGDEDAEGTEG